MTREEAIKELRGFIGQLTEGCQEAIKVLIPELAESEDERDERIRKIITDSVFYQYGTCVEYTDVLDYLDKLEKQKEQKPLPGFDDLTPDEKMNHPLYLEGFDVGRKVGRVEAEQKPEWSEEDEKKIHFLSRLIEFQMKDDEYIFGDGSRMISKQEAIKMLQSLRPQSHWRPSEKQMDRLFSIVAALRKDYCDDMADFLASIYKDLKKLM